jgi:hypothetical protein
MGDGMILAEFAHYISFPIVIIREEPAKVGVTHMSSAERRLYVRENFPFTVKFRVLTPGEYAKIKGVGYQSVPGSETVADIADNDKRNPEITSHTCLIDFLLQMDEKLDRIMALLSEEGEAERLISNQGTGVNISGAGMNIVVDEPLEPGQIIQARFFLSRSPLVFMTVCGEVTWATPVDENGKTVYQLGITFLDLNPSDRERIIACVFQRQREALRRRKSEGCDIGDS